MDVDIIVIGGGTIGLVAALGLHRAGRDVALVAPPASAQPGRTTALLNDSVALLEALEVWSDCASFAAPLRRMEIRDGTKRLVRAGPISFHAGELGLDAFGQNIENDVLNEVLRRSVTDCSIPTIASPIDAIEHRSGCVRVRSQEGDIRAKLVVGADGRESITRRSAGLGARRWSYDQTALTLTFHHARPHGGTSVEIHTETGPFTQVPLPDVRDGIHRSSLVWVEVPGRTGELQDLPLVKLSEMIEERLAYQFGHVEVERRPAVFPLSGLVASSAAAKRAVLVGEATHVFPPIGAQGANLGFRDVRSLLKICSASEDPGSPSAIQQYADSRRADIAIRTGAVDILNRSLVTDALPVQISRALGTSMFRRVPALRKSLMRFGLSPTTETDRPEAIPS